MILEIPGSPKPGRGHIRQAAHLQNRPFSPLECTNLTYGDQGAV